MTGKEDTIHVPRFSLVPIGAHEQSGNGWHGGSFICIRLDSDPTVVLDTQEVVDDFKSLGSGRIINSANVHHRLVASVGVVF